MTFNHTLISGTTGTGKSTLIKELLIKQMIELVNQEKQFNVVIITQKPIDFSEFKELVNTKIIKIDEDENSLNSAIKNSVDLKEEQTIRTSNNYNLIVIIDELVISTPLIDSTLEGILRIYNISEINFIVVNPYPSTKTISNIAKSYFKDRICLYVTSRQHSNLVLDSPLASEINSLWSYYYKTAYEQLELRSINQDFDLLLTDYIDMINKYHNGFLSFREIEDSIEKEKLELYETSIIEDPLIEDAIKVVIEAKKASTSYLQRQFRIGYNRAASLMDVLEARGIISIQDGSRPREVAFRTIEEYHMLMDIDEVPNTTKKPPLSSDIGINEIPNAMRKPPISSYLDALSKFFKSKK